MIEAFRILDTLSQGVFCIDRNYRIIYWNRLLEFWSGISADKAIGKELETVFPSMKKKLYKLMINQVIDIGTTAVFSYQLHKELFKFESGNHNLCIQSQVVRSALPGKPSEYCAVFSLQDISGLISQIEINKQVKNQVLKLVDELKLANDELQKAASTDPLTGLSNRRSMTEFIIREEERFKRYHTSYSIVLTDIDRFKQFNDVYGHACGDYILKEMGRVFLEIIRPTDRVSRWGGEEFLFLLPETDRESSFRSAERIRSIIENHDFSFEGTGHRVTMSFGVSSTDDDLEPNRLINSADQALYKAKERGRNRVVLYSEAVD
jgi:diguanylate cyclase (GGDEF)-like protein